ncbi:Arc family DNA-binding protein [Pseudomonas sp. 25 R 14]|uniref:Arc family DNA-binding protein n=1 Tax=Pseudomonas sp. 25 R 14 TaxID=1844109 RepID=UPI0008122802|nr:Arc family DNA-binding protein [Pseudomonas sp. 25 R 14]KAA6164755.1 Arc family DNA-binding protein [Pseudomonas marginalis]CRM84816.1 Arc-like DNA binding domain protein [Pseudomonas sp. 25 R 14]
MPNDLEAFIVRLPSHLHAKIKAAAKADRRSMNNEIVGRLESSFASDQLNNAEDRINILLMQQIERLEKKIQAYERACSYSQV